MGYQRCARCCGEIRKGQNVRPIPLWKQQRVLPPHAQKYRDECERRLSAAQRAQIGAHLHACFPQGCLKLVEQECAALERYASLASTCQPDCVLGAVLSLCVLGAVGQAGACARMRPPSY